MSTLTRSAAAGVTATPSDVARMREGARRSNGQFGEHAHSEPEARLGFGHCMARDLQTWLGDAERFTLDGIMHSRHNGPDRFLTLQFNTSPQNLARMREMSDRDGMQGIAINDPAAGKHVRGYDPERVLEVHVFHCGQHQKHFVSPARLVELTHAWFTSGRDEPLVTTETEEDGPSTQAAYRAMRRFSNRYRHDASRPTGMADYGTWWREPSDARLAGLGFMDGDAVVVTETGFDLLEMKNGYGPLRDRMKAGQRITLEAWGRLDGCRAFAIDENGDTGRTEVIEYDSYGAEEYVTTLQGLRDELVAAG